MQAVEERSSQKIKRMKVLDMELALSSYFNYRVNMIVPNISWGLFIHECDLLIVTASGYAWEVEIKTNKQDLKRDAEKKHGHQNEKIKRLYFALPDYLQGCDELVPAHAGILKVSPCGFVDKVREATESKTPYQFSAADRFQMGRLATMRIWTYKKRIQKMKELESVQP